MHDVGSAWVPLQPTLCRWSLTSKAITVVAFRPPRAAPLWWHVLNYVARAVVVIVGVFLAVGGVPVPPESEPFTRTFGVVMALFGVYRIAWYSWRSRRWQDEESAEP
jgi:hypothetical protein